MTNVTLAQSYLIKATKRLLILPVLRDAEAWSDVVREAQEIVELSLKGILRHVGIEPPRWHDVGDILREHEGRLPEAERGHVARLSNISAWLRKEREFSFYGEIDFIPTEQYDAKIAGHAIEDARFTVEVATRVIPAPNETDPA